MQVFWKKLGLSQVLGIDLCLIIKNVEINTFNLLKMLKLIYHLSLM